MQNSQNLMMILMVFLENNVIKFGLCCAFHKVKINFKTMNYSNYLRFCNSLGKEETKNKLHEIYLYNVINVLKSLKYCKLINVAAYRISSNIFPLYTHKEVDNPIIGECNDVLKICEEIRIFSLENDIRLSFHPDQFTVLNSPDEKVYKNSFENIVYHYNLCTKLFGCDIITLHGGGVYGDKENALERLYVNLKSLGNEILPYICLENDDKCFSSQDLLPLCEKLNIRFILDIHHQRCYGGCEHLDELIDRAVKTWKNEIPHFHISSPINGYKKSDKRNHANYIDIEHLPLKLLFYQDVIIDVEAKYKEVAIKKLQKEIRELME